MSDIADRRVERQTEGSHPIAHLRWPHGRTCGHRRGSGVSGVGRSGLCDRAEIACERRHGDHLREMNSRAGHLWNKKGPLARSFQVESSQIARTLDRSLCAY